MSFREWLVAPREEDDMCENVILAIGSNQFAKTLFSEARAALGVRQLVAYRYRPDDGVELLMAESADDDANMHRVIGDYSKALYKQDPIRDRIQTVACRQLGVHHVEASAISDATFRDSLYRAQGMATKTAIVVQRPTDVLAIGFFRGEDAPALSGQQWDFIERSAGMIAAAVERHFDIMASAVSLDWAGRLEALAARTGLSTREIEVCTQILEGYFNEAIALNLDLSVHSVITYRRRAFAKLGISTQNELFTLAVRSRAN